jgi:Kef-type K+ transport system membrane component KefB
LNILLIILILLVVTRVFGELAERASLPALVGELVAGICLGYLLLRFQYLAPSIWFTANSDIFAGLADLGMFFLMLLAGIRMEPLEFARSSKSANLIALGGMLVPVSVGYALGVVVLPESDYKMAQCLFSAIVIMAIVTTVVTPIALQFLWGP